MTTTQLVTMTAKQIAREYRHQYAMHQSVAQAYADGQCDSSDLRASANYLKTLRAAFAVAKEAP